MNNTNGLVAGIIMVVIFIAGFGLGHVTAYPDYDDEYDDENGMMEELFGGDSDNSDDVEVSGSVSQTVPESGTTIDASVMTDGQRKLLESLGVDTNSITITPEMISCAESTLGNDRVTAIQNGDTPSFIEGTKLMKCYTAG
jgi:hypothetical protein